MSFRSNSIYLGVIGLVPILLLSILPGIGLGQSSSVQNVKANEPGRAKIIAEFPKVRLFSNVAISPDGNRIAISNVNELVLYDWIEKTGRFKKLLKLDKGSGVLGRSFMRFSIDGNRLVASDLYKTQLYEITKSPTKLEPLSLFKRGGDDVVVNSKMTRVVFYYGSKDNTFRIFDLSTGKQVMEMSNEIYPSLVGNFHLSEKGTQLVVTQGARTVLIDVDAGNVVQTHLWSFQSPEFDRLPEEMQATILRSTPTRISRDGRFVGSPSKKVVFEIATGKQISKNNKIDNKKFWITPDAKWFFAADSSGFKFKAVDGDATEFIEFETRGTPKIDFASNSGRMIAGGAFSKIVVVEYPFDNGRR